MSRWDHCCELEVSTLKLLFERQEASLLTLSCNRYSSSYDGSTTVISGMNSLSVQSMDLDRGGCCWAAAMIAENAESLSHLHIGFTTHIAHDFALKRRPQYRRLSTLFTADLKTSLSDFDRGDQLIHLSLESLWLCGLDIGNIVRGEMAFDIDFNNMTRLRLESCPGLSQAFSLFIDPASSSKLALGALEDLFVRLEDPDANFSGNLESFLTAIRGLYHLSVLIDKALAVQDLEPILKVHGKTLDTLVWDERSGPRTHLDTSTSLLSTRFRNLRVISHYCPSLTTLAIPLSWEAISSSDKYHGVVIQLIHHGTETRKV